MTFTTHSRGQTKYLPTQLIVVFLQQLNQLLFPLSCTDCRLDYLTIRLSFEIWLSLTHNKTLVRPLVHTTHIMLHIVRGTPGTQRVLMCTISMCVHKCLCTYMHVM